MMVSLPELECEGPQTHSLPWKTSPICVLIGFQSSCKPWSVSWSCIGLGANTNSKMQYVMKLMVRGKGLLEGQKKPQNPTSTKL